MEFSTATPKESGWYWMQDITTFNDPEIVFVRPVHLDQDSELGFMRVGSQSVKPLSAFAGMKQWQLIEFSEEEKPKSLVIDQAHEKVIFKTRDGLEYHVVIDEEDKLKIQCATNRGTPAMSVEPRADNAVCLTRRV